MSDPLFNPGCIKIQGKDASKFLQGQLTCDVDSILPEKGQLAAHCNPQGRIISLFYLCLHQQTYYALLPKNMADIALAALKRYAVFYQLELSHADSAETETITDLILKQFAQCDLQGWCQYQLQHGIPMILPETSGKFLPNELRLDKLLALSFNKGCYTGQEIIARLHYRGQLKNKMYRVRSTALLNPGSDIQNHDQKICGSVINAYSFKNQFYALALLDNSSLPLLSDQHLILSSEHLHEE